MKRISVLFITLVAIFIISGCNNQPTIKSEEKLMIEKLIDKEGQYEAIKEIKDKNEIEKVLNIFKKAEWVNASDKSTYPLIKINDFYALWITSDNTLKIRMDSLDKNTVLSKEDSRKLYEIITDKKLSE